jgi:hypothetical protein
MLAYSHPDLIVDGVFESLECVLNFIFGSYLPRLTYTNPGMTVAHLWPKNLKNDLMQHC